MQSSKNTGLFSMHTVKTLGSNTYQQACARQTAMDNQTLCRSGWRSQKVLGQHLCRTKLHRKVFNTTAKVGTKIAPKRPRKMLSLLQLTKRFHRHSFQHVSWPISNTLRNYRNKFLSIFGLQRNFWWNSFPITVAEKRCFYYRFRSTKFLNDICNNFGAEGSQYASHLSSGGWQ